MNVPVGVDVLVFKLLQPCCTVFNNDGYWYRAEVVGLPTSDIAEVLYVDYGNTGRVSPALVCQYCLKRVV